MTQPTQTSSIPSVFRISQVLRSGEPDAIVTIRGWVRTKREQKTFTFIEVNDGSSMAGLQVVVSDAIEGYAESIKRINTGASVEVEGKLVPSPGKGQRIEMQAIALIVHGEADPETYPLQKKRHSFEFLRDIAIAHQHPQRRLPGS
jgi:asparaginyl-tRNA synthetase